MRPTAKGSAALFTWQTILVIRLAVRLRDAFRIELQSHSGSLRTLRETLRARSFVSLWGLAVELDADGQWRLRPMDDARLEDGVLIRLDPHLEALRDGFGGDGLTPGQMELFTLPALQARQAAASSVSRRSA